MAYTIPPVATAVYLSLFGIALLACGAPLLVLRRDGVARTLRNVGLAAILVVPVIAGLGYTLADNELRLENGKLMLHAAHFYQQERALEDFDLARARAGSLDAMPEVQLLWRRNGISLPGYAAGRFTGQGREVFALLTDRSRVVYLPAVKGPSLVISVEQPERFLETLRNRH